MPARLSFRIRCTLPLLFCSGVCLAQASTPAPAAPQSAEPTAATISVDARLVTLPVVVHDKKGKVVTGFTKDDFTLTEDGHPETIRYFTLDDLPLTMVLSVDTSQSVSEALDAERTASQSFLDTMLARPTDRAGLLHFDHEVELLQDLTSSKPKLNEALNELGPTPAENSSSDSGSSDSGTRRRGGTQLYDAIYLASNDVLNHQQGRKAIIVLSDGEDRGSRVTMHEAIEAAQKAEAVVYTIYFKGEEHNTYQNGPGNGGRRGGMGYPGGGGMGYPGGGYPGGGYPGGRRGGQQPTEPHVDGKKIMQQLAGETGGDFFEAKKKENFGDIYKQIADELHAQYLLAYTPATADASEGFHRISVTTKKKDLFVQTRDGFYGKESSR